MWHFSAAIAPRSSGRSAAPAAAPKLQESVHVRVALASGRLVMDRSFPGTSSTNEVCEHVAARLFDGTSASRLCLLHAGRVLDKACKLGDMKLADGDVLTLVKQSKRRFAKLEGEVPRSRRVVRLTAAIMCQDSPARRMVCDTLAPQGTLQTSYTVNEDFVVQVLVDATMAHIFPHYTLMANVMLLVLDTSQPLAETSEKLIHRAEAIHACMRTSGLDAEPSVVEAVRHVVLLSVSHPAKARVASREDVAKLAKKLRCQHKEVEATASEVEQAFEEALDGYVDKYELQSFVGVPSWLKSSQLSGAFHLDS